MKVTIIKTTYFLVAIISVALMTLVHYYFGILVALSMIGYLFELIEEDKQ